MSKLIINREWCKSCGLCINTCPKKIIERDNSELNSKGYYPVKLIDSEKCTGCSSCAIVCPHCAIEIE